MDGHNYLQTGTAMDSRMSHEHQLKFLVPFLIKSLQKFAIHCMLSFALRYIVIYL